MFELLHNAVRTQCYHYDVAKGAAIALKHVFYVTAVFNTGVVHNIKRKVSNGIVASQLTRVQVSIYFYHVALSCYLAAGVAYLPLGHSRDWELCHIQSRIIFSEVTSAVRGLLLSAEQGLAQHYFQDVYQQLNHFAAWASSLQDRAPTLKLPRASW